MSEQFAMQPEEFESTNSQLDTILDRLNALGDSAAEMKLAPLRPLQSVPDLESAAADVAPNLTIESPPVVPHGDQAVVPHDDQAPRGDVPVVEISPAPETAILDSIVEDDTVVENVRREAPAVEPHLIAVEHHEPDVETAQDSDELVDSILEIVESEPIPLVFEMTAEEVTERAAIEVPEAPTSIFSSSLSQTSEADKPDSDEADGWVSYHESETLRAAVTADPDLLEAPEFASAETSEFASAETSEFASAETSEFASAETSVFASAERVEPVIPEHVSENVTEERSYDSYTIDSTEEAQVEALAPQPDGALDAFAAMAQSDEPVTIAGIDTPLVELDESDLYGADEDLPLPDFTGVYAEAAEGEGFWGDSESGVPEPMETGFSVTVPRDELDRLRPLEETIEEEKSSKSVTVKLQFLMVLLFGIIALAIVLLNDPQVIDDMRDSFTNLLD